MTMSAPIDAKRTSGDQEQGWARRVDLWLDLRSPYSYLAKDLAYALEVDFGVSLHVKPFVLDIPSAYGGRDGKELNYRKIKYLYTDVRRFAAPRGLAILAPKKIYDPMLAHLAWLFADRGGKARPFLDLAYRHFFLRELDYEDRTALAVLLERAGVDPTGFDDYVTGGGPGELALLQGEAENQGVFSPPTFVIDGELFWGQDRIEFAREKLRTLIQKR